MLETLLPLALVVALIWLLYTRLAPVRGVATIGPAELRARLKGPRAFLLVDVREPHEYRAGHLPGAINLPLSQLAVQHHRLPKDKPIILYCASGMRSKQAARWLKKRGYTHLVNVRGGLIGLNDVLVR
ncbi:rhodanese-like domain-containing protein [Calditerricola satsumensis]|uniref:Sulfurtransferase n=1 Tax=Calditerricola satsumensis TaxID=373054 RepID=A0A8J3B3V1_9BACI|nr:rhodanese-like domain-containing protein [Calditerricola satsumensis]GGJ93723.1 sulfurtransferase [Calditerricola satsumensis]